MGSQKTLELIRGLAAAGRIRLSWHAEFESMVERNVGWRDVRKALTNAHSCRVEDAEKSKWRVKGPDMDGDDLTLVVIVEEGLLVVTVF